LYVCNICAVVVQRWIRERLGRAARWTGRRQIAVLAVIATVVVPVLPQAAAAGEATSARSASVAVPLPAVELSGTSAPADNTADETPEKDSFREAQAPPPLIARAATLDSGQSDRPTADPCGARPLADDAFLVGVYRCNPDGRGPPRRA
jgi:hypothetical protein